MSMNGVPLPSGATLTDLRCPKLVDENILRFDVTVDHRWITIVQELDPICGLLQNPHLQLYTVRRASNFCPLFHNSPEAIMIAKLHSDTRLILMITCA